VAEALDDEARASKLMSGMFGEETFASLVGRLVCADTLIHTWDLAQANHDTAAFAVNAIRRWWDEMGRARYPKAKRLLVTADSGGSNGYRSRLFKVELAKLADETGLEITVCHFPPGTSKWNKIEHRLFSFITINWRGRQLTDYRTVVEFIGATTSKTGLIVQAEWDDSTYPLGTKITDEELNALPMRPGQGHGEWN
jgi:hypothetical protein